MEGTIGGAGGDDKTDTAREEVAALARSMLRVGAALGGRVFADVDLHPSDRAALRALDELAAGATPVTNTLLAARVHRSPSATVALVDRLVAAGLVERRRGHEDRREVHIALTDHARAVGAAHLRPYARRIAAAAGRLSPDEAAVVAGFLAAVLDGPAD